MSGQRGTPPKCKLSADFGPKANAVACPNPAEGEMRSIPAARGGNWSAVQVARLLEAVGSRFDGAKVGAHPKAIYIHTAIHIVATKNRMMLA